MEHNTNRILWTVLVLAIGVTLYIAFRPSANNLLKQSINKIQTITTNVHGDTNDSSHTNSSSSSNTSTTIGPNLLTGTAKFDFPFHNNNGTFTIQKYDDETNYIQSTYNTPISGLGIYWGCWGGTFIPTVGQVYTLYADVSGNGYIQGNSFRYEGGDNGNLGRIDLTNNWQRVSNTVRINTTSGWVNWIIYANNSTSLKIKHIKIEKGSVATPYTP